MSATVDRGELESYYGRPILKAPVWKPEIPMYFFTGGVAGASSLLSLAGRAARNERIARTSLFVGLAAEIVSPALLVSDLGRPERFLKMLRVFKVTSPMNVGSWILATSGSATTTAAACELSGRLPRVKLAAEALSALAGAPLATYTATLLTDTAIPVWHEARRELPFVFASSAAASAGAAAALFMPPSEAGPARRLAIGGAVAQNVAMAGMEARLGFVGEPYHQGVAGALNWAARAATLSGAWLLARGGGRRRSAAVAGSALVLGGEVALRFSVFRAGFQSARDPRYTVRPQRERLTASRDKSAER